MRKVQKPHSFLCTNGLTVTGRCVLVDRPCGQTDLCALHLPWARARAGLLDELGRISLADLEVS